MTRRLPFFLALLLVPAAYAIDFGPIRRVADLSPDAYARLTVDALAADGKVGGVAFSREAGNPMSLVATPIDAAGTPHPEQAVTLARAVDLFPAVAAKTPNGYLVGFSDAQKNPFLLALKDDLSPAASLLPFGTDPLLALACNGSVCAGSTRTSLLLLDQQGRTLATIAQPRVRKIVAVNNGGFAAEAPPEVSDQGPGELVFISADGTLTARVIVPQYDVAIAAHPSGVAMFWPVATGLYGAIVNFDGTVSAAVPLPVIPFATDDPVAATNGDQITILFEGVRPINCVCYGYPEIYGERVSLDLNVLEAPIKLSPSGFASLPLLRASGNGFIAAWQHQPDLFFTAEGSRALRIAPASPLSANASRALGSAPARQSADAIAASANNVLVLWRSFNRDGRVHVNGRRLDSFGSPLDAAPIDVTTDSDYVLAASDGHDFLVASINGITHTLDLFTIDGQSGAVRHADTLPQISSVGQLASDGAGYTMTLNAFPGAELVRFTPDGRQLWTKALPLGAGTRLASVSATTIIQSDYASSTSVTYNVVDSDGRVTATHAIQTPFPASLTAVVSNRRDQFLLLFGGESKVLAARVRADGTPIDAAAVVVAQSGPVTFAVPVRDHWLVFSNQQAVDFPSLTPVSVPADAMALTGAPLADGRAMLLVQQPVADGLPPLWATAVRTVSDLPGMPPRRRPAIH